MLIKSHSWMFRVLGILSMTFVIVIITAIIFEYFTNSQITDLKILKYCLFVIIIIIFTLMSIISLSIVSFINQFEITDFATFMFWYVFILEIVSTIVVGFIFPLIVHYGL